MFPEALNRALIYTASMHSKEDLFLYNSAQHFNSQCFFSPGQDPIYVGGVVSVCTVRAIII